uniref:Uncharacterized protein n=1 Tax=Rhizochromulina marina TaxID=1034831 RepID=A0A7S2SW99_9STRA
MCSARRLHAHAATGTQCRTLRWSQNFWAPGKSSRSNSTPTCISRTRPRRTGDSLLEILEQGLVLFLYAFQGLFLGLVELGGDLSIKFHSVEGDLLRRPITALHT